MTETLNDRLDRIESAIKSLSDKINNIKPADINKKQVSKMIDNLSSQIKSIKPGVSEGEVSAMISDSISEIKPQENGGEKAINDTIRNIVDKDFVTKLYRGR